MSFKWLNKQGVESDSGFSVQCTGRFKYEYREAGRTIELEVEMGFSAGRACVSINKNAFERWGVTRAFHTATQEERERLMNNFKAAMAFQDIDVYVG